MLGGANVITKAGNFHINNITQWNQC
jgi:hypothetical protein